MKTKATVFLISLLAIWQSVSAEIRVNYTPGSPTKGIQEAINKVSASGGGTVFIPKGNYVISCSIVIPKAGNLTIYGEGSSSVIEVEPEYTGFASADIKKGAKTISVKNPGMYKISDDIVIVDDSLINEDQTSTARITGIKGNILTLDSPMHNNYSVTKNARLIHTFHMMVTEGIVDSIVVPGLNIRNLQFVGGLKKNYQGFELWQVNGGVVIMGQNLRIENCVVRDIPADAIFVGGGLQEKENIWVSGCLIENAGHRGIHIGNDPRNVNISNNHFNKIGGIGIYLCHGSQRVILTGNTICNIGTYETSKGQADFITLQGFAGNDYQIKTQVAGIGGLGGGGVEKREHDKYNVISNNVIYNSKGAGISFLKWFQEEGGRPGENMIITGNNLYKIEKSALFVFAAQSIQFSSNMITDCNTAIDCSESIFCFFTGNTMRNCMTAFSFHSTDENYATTKNVSSNNMLINCKVTELNGNGSKNNLSVNNHIMND